MIVPGFSSMRIPMKIRLFFAIAVSLSLAPLLLPANLGQSPAASQIILLQMVVEEILKGVVIGTMARFFLLSLQFAASGMAMFIGMGTMPGTPIEGAEPVPALVSLITLSALTLIFVTDLHLETIRAILASYDVSPIGEGFQAWAQLDEIVSRLSSAMFLSIRVVGPFVIYAVMINLAIGLTNKLTPQIPIYFISLPFVLLGGLILFFLVYDQMLAVFIGGYGDWLANG